MKPGDDICETKDVDDVDRIHLSDNLPTSSEIGEAKDVAEQMGLAGGESDQSRHVEIEMEALVDVVEDEEKEEEGLIPRKDEVEVSREWILQQGIVYKFCLYGFLKNLQMFEAYLIVVLMSYGLDLSQIGILQGIQAFTTLSCEYPSGIIADRVGKKNSLLSSFIMYALCFVLYSFGAQSYGMLACASALYGMAEAFRSGCHKAMIIAWLERHEKLDQKTFLYSRTRSFSNLGSAVNAVAAVVLVVYLPSAKWIFRVSVLPMLIDFAMVSTYPSYMNESETAQGQQQTICTLIHEECQALMTLLRESHSRRRLLSSSIFQALHKGLKDYIQPIMVALGGAMLIKWGVVDKDDEEARDKAVKILVGGLYASFYLISCAGTRNAYRIAGFFSSEKVAMDRIFDFFSALTLGISIAVALATAWPVIPMYMGLYFLMNTRSPLAVSQVSDLMGRARRTTVLSVQSLTVSFLLLIFAPLFGVIAHYVALEALFFVVGLGGIAVNHAFLSEGCPRS